MALFFSIFPIVLLIYLMVKRNGVPSYYALPLTAILIYILQLFYFERDITLLNANIVSGYISTLTPITVIFGAVLFNRTLEVSGTINVIRRWLSNINPNPVAQLMIIAWAFAFMIEGASGFGTPAAIAAPILVGLGFKPLRVAILTLVMNSVPVSFGAVGTPTWFGFGPLHLGDSTILQIGNITALIHSIEAFVIPLVALSFIVSWKEIKRNILFVYISVFACVIPYFVLAQVNYEFPSLVGGAIGLFVSVLVANKGVGLSKDSVIDKSEAASSLTIFEAVQGKREKPLKKSDVFRALLPTGLLIAILIITRIQQLPFKAFMNDNINKIFDFSLGYLGEFSISRGLVFSLNHILGTPVGESYKLLYVPALIPFGIVSLVTFFIYRLSIKQVHSIATVTIKQGFKPFWALFGALVMVKLMLIGGDDSMVKIIGKSFAELTGKNWTIFASYLGAIGAFFSGSNTVSNLTFGGVQLSTAELVGVPTTLILALQSVGGAMGNMVCLNNIIAVNTVLNIQNQEGAIIKKTVVPMFIYGVIAALVAYLIIPIFYTF